MPNELKNWAENTTAEPEGKARKGQEIRSIFSFDSKLEDDTIDAYNQFILVCRDNGDSSSMKIFEVVVDEEQAHFNSLTLSVNTFRILARHIWLKSQEHPLQLDFKLGALSPCKALRTQKLKHNPKRTDRFCHWEFLAGISRLTPY